MKLTELLGNEFLMWRLEVSMRFYESSLPSSAEWERVVVRLIDFKNVPILQDYINFESPCDYFALSDYMADQLSLIGRTEPFLQSPPFPEFRLEIFNNLHRDTQIGNMLRNVNRYREEAAPYGLFARFLSLQNRIFVAITVCLTDKDWANEMPVSVLEIGQGFFHPLWVNEEAVDQEITYFTFDDIANLAMWLGNFWCGIQYEMINRPEEVKIVEQRGPISGNSDDNFDEAHIILVKHIIPVDENGNKITYSPTGSGREYRTPVWGVRGHPRTLQDGRVTMVRPHLKGKDRKNPSALNEKEYRFVEDKIDEDSRRKN